MEAPSPAIDSARYREVIGSFATGVAIVTAQGDDGPAGLTTNAITSLSLDPLLLLVCFDNGSRTLPIVQRAGRFAVNVLHAGQEDLARIFASKREQPEKFGAATHTVAHGVPVLDDALAWIACDLEDLHPAGDHTIGIGRVTHLSAGDAPDGMHDPLLFFRGGFARLSEN
jgi:flavin reductase (DIM6/NTAB) family NADH-FMN oxidoreductase RutF